MARTDRQTILKKLMTNYWLFENMFWKYWDNILFDQDVEIALKILKYWYKKTDVDQFFHEQVDMQKYWDTLKTIFTYYDNQNEWTKS